MNLCVVMTCVFIVWLLRSERYSYMTNTLDVRTKECTDGLQAEIKSDNLTKLNYENCTKFKAIGCDVLTKEYGKICTPYTKSRCHTMHTYMDKEKDSHIINGVCSELANEGCAPHNKCNNHTLASGVEVIFILVLLGVVFTLTATSVH